MKRINPNSSGDGGGGQRSTGDSNTDAAKQSPKRLRSLTVEAEEEERYRWMQQRMHQQEQRAAAVAAAVAFQDERNRSTMEALSVVGAARRFSMPAASSIGNSPSLHHPSAEVVSAQHQLAVAMARQKQQNEDAQYLQQQQQQEQQQAAILADLMQRYHQQSGAVGVAPGGRTQQHQQLHHFPTNIPRTFPYSSGTQGLPMDRIYPNSPELNTAAPVSFAPFTGQFSANLLEAQLQHQLSAAGSSSLPPPSLGASSGIIFDAPRLNPLDAQLQRQLSGDPHPSPNNPAWQASLASLNADHRLNSSATTGILPSYASILGLSSPHNYRYIPNRQPDTTTASLLGYGNTSISRVPSRQGIHHHLPAATNTSPQDDHSSPSGGHQEPRLSAPLSTKKRALKAVEANYDPGNVKDLSLPTDKGNLSEYQCLLREQILLFSVTLSDIQCSAQGRNKPISLGQVGVLCRHCAKIPPGMRPCGAVYFPAKLSGLYQASQNMAINHFSKSCQSIPEATRSQLLKLKERKSTVLGGGKHFWANGARVIGVVERDGQLRFAENES